MTNTDDSCLVAIHNAARLMGLKKTVDDKLPPRRLRDVAEIYGKDLYSQVGTVHRRLGDAGTSAQTNLINQLNGDMFGNDTEYPYFPDIAPLSHVTFSDAARQGKFLNLPKSERKDVIPKQRIFFI